MCTHRLVVSVLVELLTGDQLRRLSQLNADPALASRVEELAGKANKGELTDAERRVPLATSSRRLMSWVALAACPPVSNVLGRSSPFDVKQ